MGDTNKHGLNTLQELITVEPLTGKKSLVYFNLFNNFQMHVKQKHATHIAALAQKLTVWYLNRSFIEASAPP